ncbi:protocadherin-1-like [Neolamprologus brichardi]|uniref:protocadherin-1-like n=1 Tax=Neolamprologus brichardi TaxID=32507 RepID=UPI0003EC2C7B|nr:protocadherin-1-like [Neolamprologus brichardi]
MTVIRCKVLLFLATILVSCSSSPTHLNIRVDRGKLLRSSRSVTVSHQQDNAPEFDRSHYEAELLENSPLGQSVLQVRASHADIAIGEMDHSLHQVSETVQRLLRIDSVTGIIYVKGLVDREEESILKLFVVARDRDPSSRIKSSKVLVTINVTDQNDNAPTLNIQGIGLVKYQDGVTKISEDLPVGTPVALVQVSDWDEGENAVVTCAVDGDVPFQLQPASDQKGKYFLQTATLLDYESVKNYSIEIVAVDSGSPALSSTLSLNVQVTDVNDNAPNFSPATIEVDFPENNYRGQKLQDLVATDPDSGINGQLVYSIIDRFAKRLFEVDANTGEVRVRSVLDREERDRYVFCVAAADMGVPSKTGTATIIVNVQDQNDNDPVFILKGCSFTAAENMPPPSRVGAVAVLDADKDENSHLRLFVELENGNFFIQNGTGIILSRISFDREKERFYTFCLKAVDGGDPPRSSYVGVIINVLDENDNAPYVTKPDNSSYTYLSYFTPAGTFVEAVKAEDTDTGLNAELDYFIVGGNPHGLFQISPYNGEITLALEVTGKHSGLHRLVVRVCDEGRPPLCTTALVHIFINGTESNISLIEALVTESLSTPLEKDVAGDLLGSSALVQHNNILYGSLAGIAHVIQTFSSIVSNTAKEDSN